jgi:hypothetical protein
MGIFGPSPEGLYNYAEVIALEESWQFTANLRPSGTFFNKQVSELGVPWGQER